jgi:hypothetical protein
MDQKLNNEQKRPSKFYQGRGISLGVALGLIFGAAFNRIGVGLVLGIAAGTAIGRTLELQANQEANKEGKLPQMWRRMGKWLRQPRQKQLAEEKISDNHAHMVWAHDGEQINPMPTNESGETQPGE